MATTAPIILPIKTPGLNQLQKLEMKMRALEKTVSELQGDLGKANQKIAKLNDEAVKASKGVAKLSKQFRSFAASLIAAGTAQAAFNTGLDRIQSNARLVALARGYEEIEQAQAAATRTAEAFNLSQTEANKQFAAIYGRLRPLGLTVEQIEDAYAGLSTAVKTASLDAAGASALFTQVSQALGSGVVQAEELNTVIDQAPSIVVALAKELGVTAGEVKKLASTGQVSSEQLFRALLRVKDEGVDVLSESLNTPAEKIKAFYNTTEDIVAALTTAVIPELVDGVDDIAAALEALIPLAQVVGRTLSAAFKLAAIPAKGFGDLLANISQGNWEAVLKFDPSGFQQLGDIFGDLFAPLPEVKTGGGRRGDGSANFPTIPNRGGKDSKSGGSKGADAAAKAAEREAERVAKTLRDREQLVERLEQQIKIQNEVTELGKEEQRLQLEILEINQRYDNLLLKETDELIRQNTERARALELTLAQSEAQQSMMSAAQSDFTNFLKQQPEYAKAFNDELTDTEELLKGSYEIVANGLTSGIKGLIDGTKEWSDVLSDIAGQLGSMFLNMAFSSLGAGLQIPGFGEGFAEGGYVDSPTQAMIGEAGEPEYAIPSSKMSSAMERYSSGMRGEAVTAGASEYGSTEEGAMGSGSGNAPINVNYSGPIMRMDNSDYIKASELPGIINQSAKAGEARALGRLRTNVGVRQKLGMS